MNEISLEELSVERLAELVGPGFGIAMPGAAPVGLELTTVTSPRVTEASGAGARHESFSLLFDGPADRPLAQRTYPFEHERLGRFDLFIVPVGNERGRMQYQAVFNRLRRGG